jgi:hypothetical protein
MPAELPTASRRVPLSLRVGEITFLRKVTRQEYHFITDDESEARLALRDKLLHPGEPVAGHVVIEVTRDELLFLIKVARESYSFITKAEKEARLAFAARLHRAAEAVFGVGASEDAP